MPKKQSDTLLKKILNNNSERNNNQIKIEANAIEFLGPFIHCHNLITNKIQKSDLSQLKD